MLSSQLPRAPCDKFVYDFLCDFGGMVGGYGIWRMWSQFVYEHRAISCTGPRGQAGVNPYRGCAEIVQKLELLCSLHRLQTVIERRPCRFRAEAAWRWCGDRAVV